MRITGGNLRGRRLKGPVPEGVRPTPERVREALFSVLGQDLEGWSVLDACGGTGMLAFEAASRGGGPVTIVERNRDVGRQIREEAALLDLRVDVRIDDARRVLRSATWDLVLMDPPFGDEAEPWLLLGAKAAREILVLEHAKGTELPEEVEGLACPRVRCYGSTCLAIYERVG